GDRGDHRPAASGPGAVRRRHRPRLRPCLPGAAIQPQRHRGRWLPRRTPYPSDVPGP
ncbi:MAG: hypothetical protein AVDCRST_MAG33-1953, partial [uncultured Thermomicrobiales bacterium]